MVQPGSDLFIAVSRYRTISRGGKLCFLSAAARESGAALRIGNAVRALGHRHRHDHRDVHAFTAAGAIDEFVALPQTT